MEKLDSGFRTAGQIEDMLGIPVFSAVAEVTGGFGTANEAVDKPTSPFAESMRGLQLGLSLSNVDKPPKIIIVTSSVPSEGKTTVAIGLARLAARAGVKTILLEADFRRPSFANVLGIQKSRPGLTDAISKHASLEECLVKDPKSDALVLACGTVPADPANILNSKAMQQIVTDMSRAFDLVIIDSAPVLPVNDTKILSRVADAILFVVRWEATPRDAVMNAIRSLQSVNVQVSGMALTRTNTERFRYYSYGYQSYDNYEKYYSH
jgi:capsular exopolysaccharide synthesis family protein